MLRNLISKALRDIAENIESGNCNLSDEEAMDIMKLVNNEAMSKERAARYLRISRSKFDNYIRLGKIPKGKKRVGFKELVWLENDLRSVISGEN